MGKTDHLSQLKGRTLSSIDRDTKPRRKNWGQSFRRGIEVTQKQENALNIYIKNETELYNVLVEGLQSRLKSNPEFFNEMSDDHIALYGKLTKFSFNAASLFEKKSDDIKLHEELEPFRDILFGLRGNKEYGLSDRYSIFYEMCAYKSLILPQVRENMALELINFCVSQLTSNWNSLPESNSTKVLEKATILQKRHLQIPKELIKFKWNEADYTTDLWTGHLKSPIKMDSDLNEAPTPWNLMIIHQNPEASMMEKNLEWEADFRNVPNKYLISYLESTNPLEKFKSRHHGPRS